MRDFKSTVAALALGGLASLLFSCGEKIKATTSNDISVEPQDITFSSERVGRNSEPQAIRIRAGGEEPLKIKRVYLRGATEGEFEVCDRVDLGIADPDPLNGDLEQTCELLIVDRPEMPHEMQPDEFIEITVQYRARDTDPPSDVELVVESNATDEDLQTQTVRIAVLTATPRISSTDTTISFAGANMAQQKSILIKNVGTGTLEVGEPSLRVLTEQPTNPETGEVIPQFEVDYDNDLPWAILEGGSETLTIRYNPTDDIDDTADLVFPSNDPEAPNLTIRLTSAPVYAIMEVTPNPVEFGDVRGGDLREITLSVRNAGLKRLDVESMLVQQAGEDYKLDGQTSFAVSPGQTYDGVKVVYRPRTMDGSDATLLVTSNADNADDQRLVTVPLVRSVTALPAILSVDPLTADMSDVEQGGEGEATITLTNGGGTPLEISQIAFSGEADAAVAPPSDPQFTVVSGGGAATLAPGDEREVTVKFTRAADDRNQRLGALLITSNAASSPDVIYFTSTPPADGPEGGN